MIYSKALSKFNFFNRFQNITFFLLFRSCMTVNEIIFDILLHWKQKIHVITVCQLLTAFLKSDPRLHCFRKLSLPWELGSSLWSSEYAGYKDEQVFSRKVYFSFKPQKKLLSTLTSVHKIKFFLSKITPVSHNFV